MHQCNKLDGMACAEGAKDVVRPVRGVGLLERTIDSAKRPMSDERGQSPKCTHITLRYQGT